MDACVLCILTNGNAKTFKYCANIYLNVDNGDSGASSSGSSSNNNNVRVEQHTKLQAKQMSVSLSFCLPLQFLFTNFGKCRTSVCRTVCVCVRLLCCTI